MHELSGEKFWNWWMRECGEGGVGGGRGPGGQSLVYFSLRTQPTRSSAGAFQFWLLPALALSRPVPEAISWEMQTNLGNNTSCLAE